MPNTVPDAIPETIETIATFTRDGTTYEIDHLGICQDSQWGQFAIYRDGEQVDEFAIEESFLKREHQPTELPVSKAELIRLAEEALRAA
jgi:hypothetical protein